jgi:hypothetical protein
MKRIVKAVFVTLLACLGAEAVFAGEDIAICGASQGHGYYPAAGLAAIKQKKGEWHDDAIVAGSFTLTKIGEDGFDLLVSDATGRVFTAKQDGASVELFGVPTDEGVSVIVNYGKVVETYTFFRNAEGNGEAMWTSNKGGGNPIMKVGVYRADCSFFAY